MIYFIDTAQNYTKTVMTKRLIPINRAYLSDNLSIKEQNGNK